MLEGGYVPRAALAGLEAAVALLNQLGTEAIFAHIQRWHDAVEQWFGKLEQRSLYRGQPRSPPPSPKPHRRHQM